jgi:mono/diheme cytochrome c family protein
MKTVANAIVAVALCGAALTAAGTQTSPRQSTAPRPKPAVSHEPAGLSADAQNQLVKQYCAGCHSDKAKAGELSLASFDAAKAVEHADVSEKMIRKLRAGMMPPPAARRPDAATIAAFVDALETKIDAAAAASPNPGWRPFQRLNRAEYAHAVHDLLGLDVDVNAYLPPDTISGGFDNVADVQNFSPTLMEGYLRAASQISRLAVGDRSATATSATYKIGRTASQMRHVDGAPMGTRGGISVVHVFPADGEYVVKMSMHYEPLGGLYGRYSMLTMNIAEQIEVSVNGERAALVELNPRMSETDQQTGQNSLEIKTPPIHINAGPQRISAAFIQRLDGPVDDLIAPLENTLADVNISFGVTALPHMRDVTILGPSQVTGVSETVSRRKIFTCRPTTPNEEERCAADIVKRLTAQAYRGAPTADDLQDALTFYSQGRKKGDFESGIRMALQSILVSPRFLFRLESTPAAAKSASYRISDPDLASRLSFFLWDSVPDAELLKAASQGALRTSAGIEKQVRRMLTDPRAESLSTRFAAQWLRLQDLDQIFPDYLLYPQYDETLAKAMKRETELFFDSLVRDDRPVLDLLNADYTFVNERLAKHYGIPNITGNAFRRVALPEYRRGLLGQGSILTLTSVADRTSPVLRGKWVMEVLLGTPPPPPPPNVPALDDSVKAESGGTRLTTRQRMEEHRKNPTCNACHRVIDPLGLALENFDVTGAWRIKDNEMPLDSVGDLYDGTKMDGPAGLRQALMKHSDMVLRSFTENLMTYALGRRVEYYDMPAIRQIIREAGKNDNKLSSFVLGVINSSAFRMAKPDSKPLLTDSAAR